MSVDVVTEIVIARPPAAVSSFAADPDNVTAWYINSSPSNGKRRAGWR